MEEDVPANGSWDEEDAAEWVKSSISALPNGICTPQSATATNSMWNMIIHHLSFEVPYFWCKIGWLWLEQKCENRVVKVLAPQHIKFKWYTFLV